MNQFQPTGPDNSPSSPDSSIQQRAENSTIDGGMQALVGDNNNQNQANSSSTGNVVNVNVSVPPATENYKPTPGCLFRLVIGGFVISIAIGSYIFSESLQFPVSSPTPMPQEPLYNLPSSTLDISGTWHDEMGTVYQITQNRNTFEFFATNPKTGIFSRGSGTLEEGDFEFAFQTNLPSSGRGTLRVSADKEHMIGKFDDSRVGMYTLTLYRCSKHMKASGAEFEDICLPPQFYR